jgi:uncharacterized protein
MIIRTARKLPSTAARRWVISESINTHIKTRCRFLGTGLESRTVPKDLSDSLKKLSISSRQTDAVVAALSDLFVLPGLNDPCALPFTL